MKNKFALWTLVYLIHDIDQKERMITGILFEGSGVQYRIACESSTSWHYGEEIILDKDLTKL